MRRAITILSVIAICLISISTARADSYWIHVFNFVDNDGGFELNSDTSFWNGERGEWISDSGWTSTVIQRVGVSEWANLVEIDLTISESVTITSATLQYNLNKGDFVSSSGDLVHMSMNFSGNLFTSDTLNNLTNGNGKTLTTPSGSYSFTLLKMSGIASWAYTSDPGGTVVFTSLTLTGTGETDPFDAERPLGPFKPISSYELISYNDAKTSIQTRPNANVHAISDAVVTGINPNAGYSYTVTVQPAGTTAPEDQIHYWNLSSTDVQSGDVITAGCVLGLAANTHDATNEGGGEIQFTAPDPIQTDWTIYDDAPDNTRCDASRYKTDTCININPNFADNAKGWNLSQWFVGSGPPAIIGDAVELPAGTGIYQDVQLDPEETYIVTLSVAVMGAAQPTQVVVNFGDADSSIPVNPSQPGAYLQVSSQTLSPGTPNFAPDLYRLEILNPHQTAPYITPTIRIKFACIGTEAPELAPGACYFDDPNLLSDTWDKSEGVTYTPAVATSGNAGMYTIPPGGEIYRPVAFSAFLDHDTDFDLLTKTTNGAGTPLLPPYGRWHAFIRDPVSLDTIQDVGTWDTLPVIVTIHVSPFTVDQGLSLDGDLVIKNISDEIDETGWDLNIHEACLQVDGGIWPGKQNSDSNSLVIAECTLCLPPGDVSDIATDTLLGWIVQWLGYGWCYLGFILRCLLLTAVNGVWQTILTFMQGVALFGTWVGLVVGAVAGWLRDGLRFAFNNAMAWGWTAFNSLVSWLLGLPFIQNVIDTLSLAKIWIDGVFGVIVAIVNLFLLGLQFLSALLSLIGDAWQAFLTGMSSTATSLFPFPDCTDSESTLYDVCIPLDVVNYLVTKLPALILLINASAFAVAWRQIRKIRRNLKDVFTSS